MQNIPCGGTVDIAAVFPKRIIELSPVLELGCVHLRMFWLLLKVSCP
jgi:hypothetical protein